MAFEQLNTPNDVVPRHLPRLLQRDKVRRCALGECQAACCTGGVWLNPEEVPRILEWAEIIKSYLPRERHDESKWFELGGPDPRFPEGYEVGTTAVDDSARPGQTCCVFLRPDRICALQLASKEHGQGWPGLKPFYCALYPLYLEDGVLTFDDVTPLDFEDSGCRRPACEARPLYTIYREEAILVLGEDGYQELCEKASGDFAQDASPKTPRSLRRSMTNEK